MKRAIASVLLALPVVTVLSTAEAADSANDCVRLRESPDTSGVALDVDNNCDRRLSCAVSWTVECQNDQGKVTKSAKESASFVLQASASGHALASTKACTSNNWKVDDVSWECAAVK